MNAQRAPASPRQGCEAAAPQPGNVGYRRRVVVTSWELQELGRGSGARQLEPIESRGRAAVEKARANRHQSPGGGSEEEGGRKWLVRWSRTLEQRAAIGADCEARAVWCYAVSQAKALLCTREVELGRWSQDEVSRGKLWDRIAVLRVAELTKKCCAKSLEFGRLVVRRSVLCSR